MSKTRIGIETNLDVDDLCELRDRIIDRLFEKLEGGLSWGFDMRTARILFPRQVAVLRRLEAQWRANR